MKKRFGSPTVRLLVGLVCTLAAVAVFSVYAITKIGELRQLQTNLVDRNRKDSLQLLRIQNDLNELGLAMRDMLVGDEPYPLSAWKGQFNRIRRDFQDAMRLEESLAPEGRSPDQTAYVAELQQQFWTSADQAFALAAQGNEASARALVRNSLAAQISSLITTVSRLLIANQEAQERALVRIHETYDRVERSIYIVMAAVLVLATLISLYIIHSNNRFYARLAQVSEQRSELSRKLISMQEEILRSVSRELHDEFGQILTAMGTLLSRAERLHAPDNLKADLREIRDVAQETLEKTRTLSQALHPAILDNGTLDDAIEWYLPVFEKQSGIQVLLERDPGALRVGQDAAIHVYRVLQEGLSNVAKHSGTKQAWVRIRQTQDQLSLEVEDRGIGIRHRKSGSSRGGLGLVAIRERADLLNGTVELSNPPEGGTLMRLQVPLGKAIPNGK